MAAENPEAKTVRYRKAAQSNRRTATFVCQECGKTESVVRHDGEKRKFCSIACYWADELRRRAVRNAASKTHLTCEQCGQLFLVGKNELHRRFCGLKCKSVWQSTLPFDDWRGKLCGPREKLRGDKNGMWGKRPAHGKWVAYTSSDGREFRLRSQWEAAVAKYLDAVDMRWEYEPKRFILDDRTYLPDFWLNDAGVFWEVKGWMSPRHTETIRQFRRRNPGTPLVVIGSGSIRGIAASVGQAIRL